MSMNGGTRKVGDARGILMRSLVEFHRIILGLAVLLAVLHSGSARAADPEGVQLGEALMRMGESEPTATVLTRAVADGWYVCDVKRVGPGWGNVYLRLVCGSAVPEQWFIARQDQESDMLAAGLTAISLTKKVNVYLADMPTGYHEIRACYVMQ